MGCNKNLQTLIGLPKKSLCPKCKQEFYNSYDEFDIESGDIGSSYDGRFDIFNFCENCEIDFVEKFEIKFVKSIIITGCCESREEE